MRVKELAKEFIIPKKSAKAFPVKKGEILRVIEVEGPQVTDFNAFNLHNPQEKFSAGRTRSIYGIRLGKGDKLYSSPGFDNVMFTIVEDTVKHKLGPHGAKAHDLMYPRCSRRGYEIRRNIKDHPNCHDQLSEAIKQYSLTPDYVHDTFNIFMKTGIDELGRKPFIAVPDSKKGDYVELQAEMDCLVAISACPSDDVTNAHEPKPLKIQIYHQRPQ